MPTLCSTPDEKTLLMIREALSYCKESGSLTWNVRPRNHFKTNRAHSVWNTRYAGEKAYIHSVRGYADVKISNKLYRGHRVAWFLVTGRWLDECQYIDHINGERFDNRWCNLRCVSHQENMKNRKVSKNSPTGVNGVTWYKKSGKWAVKIHHAGVKLHVGYYETLLDAVAARYRAEREQGYHKNHGRR